MAHTTIDLQDLITSLEESLLSQDGGCTAFIAPDISSREYILSILIRRSQKKGINITHLTSVDEVHQAMSELSLFSSKTLYIVNGVSFGGQTIADPPPGSSLFLLADSKGALPKNGNSWTRIAIPTEKPWEQQSRLLAWTRVLFQMRKKIPEEELLHALCNSCENDCMRIGSEVEKITLFAGSATNISLQLAAQISTLSHSEKEWNIAENIVWNGAKEQLPSDDHTEFFRFLGLLRYHMHLGLALSTTRDPKKVLQERYPKLMKKGDKLYLPKVHALGKEYFIQGNVALSELEKMGRTASHALRHYWDIFIINMRCHI